MQYNYVKKSVIARLDDFEDWEYLIHHVHKDTKKKVDEIHHCPMLDHLGNLYEVSHIKDSKGKIRHCLTGLKKDQKVYWSDEAAKDDKQKVPCSDRQLK